MHGQQEAGKSGKRILSMCNSQSLTVQLHGVVFCAVQMRQARAAGEGSAARDRSPSENRSLWHEMQQGSETGRRYCLRFRLQPDHVNKCLRDPVAFRVLLEPHYKTGLRGGLG